MNAGSAGGSKPPATQGTLYGLVNGIGNTNIDPRNVPDYINNLESDMASSSNKQIVAFRDFVKSALYQGLGILGLDHIKDAMSLFWEASSRIFHLFSVLKITIDFDNRFRWVPTDRNRPMVAMGYSGGFLPLVEAIGWKGYNAKTIVGLGAATTSILNVPPTVFGEITGLITLGNITAAASILANYLSPVKDLKMVGVERFVNVWGSEDVLKQFGLTGKRDSLDGIKTYNIEIVDATHFDYMRRTYEPDPVKADLNKRVSQFVVGLMEVANDDQKLVSFLQSKIGTADSDGVWRFKP